MQRNGVALAAVVALACLLGCGGGRHSSPQATAEAMQAACRAGDKEAVMACFCDDSRQKLTDLDTLFAELVEAQPEIATLAKTENLIDTLMANARAATVEYGETAIDGDEATLEVTSDGTKETVQFVREGGDWRVFLPVTDQDIENAREKVELAKKMPKGMLEGLQKLGEKIKKDSEEKQP